MSDQTIYNWRNRDQIDRGLRAGLSTAESAELTTGGRRIRELETELGATRRVNELLKAQTDPRGGGSLGQRRCPQPARVRLAQRRARVLAAVSTANTGRFGRDDLTVDHTARIATCPAGHTVAVTRSNNAVFGQRCTGCPIRSRCTTARDGRILKLSDHTSNSSKPDELA